MGKKSFLLFIGLITVISFVTFSTISESEDKHYTISGKVQNQYTKEALDSAKVIVVIGSIKDIQFSEELGLSANADIEQKSTYTDSEGLFEIKTKIEDTRDIGIIITKASYLDTTLSIEGAEPGNKRDLGTINMLPDYQPLTVKGQLLNSFNDEPIEGGIINTDLLEQTLTTDAQGKFTFSVEINQPQSVQLVFEKEYFVDDTLVIDINFKKNKNIDNIYLKYIY